MAKKAKEAKKAEATPKSTTASRGARMAHNALPFPEVLSFRRSFEFIEGTMSCKNSTGGTANEKLPIRIYRHGKRNSFGAEARRDGARAVSVGNLNYMEEAKLRHNTDTLVVEGGVTVLPIVETAELCNEIRFGQMLEKTIMAFKQYGAGHIATAARMYAYNILNGAWLWRNRDVSNKVTVTVTYELPKGAGDATIVIDDALDLALTITCAEDANIGEDGTPLREQFDAFASAIADTLAGKNRFLKIKFTAECFMMAGQSVWPSQLYLPKKPEVAGDDNRKVTVGRSFAKIETGNDPIGVISAEKIWNAIRRIDVWHKFPGFEKVAIAVEPTGATLKYSEFFRSEAAKSRIYDLLPKLVNIVANNQDNPGIAFDEQAGGLEKGELCFIAASFTRGGLFGHRANNRRANADAPADGAGADAAATPDVTEGNC